MARRQHSREQRGSFLKKRRNRAKRIRRDPTTAWRGHPANPAEDTAQAVLFPQAARWQPGLSDQVVPLARVFGPSPEEGEPAGKSPPLAPSSAVAARAGPETEITPTWGSTEVTARPSADKVCAWLWEMKGEVR